MGVGAYPALVGDIRDSLHRGRVLAKVQRDQEKARIVLEKEKHGFLRRVLLGSLGRTEQGMLVI